MNEFYKLFIRTKLWFIEDNLLFFKEKTQSYREILTSPVLDVKEREYIKNINLVYLNKHNQLLNERNTLLTKLQNAS